MNVTEAVSEKLEALEDMALSGPPRYNAAGEPFHTGTRIINGYKVQVRTLDEGKFNGVSTVYEIDGFPYFSREEAVKTLSLWQVV